MADYPFYHVILEEFDVPPEDAFFSRADGIAARSPAVTAGMIENYWVRNTAPQAGRFSHVRWMKFTNKFERLRFKYSRLHDEAVEVVVPRFRSFATGDLDLSRVRPPVRADAMMLACEGYCRLTMFQPKAAVPADVLDEVEKLVGRIRKETPDVLEFYFDENVSPFAHNWSYASLRRFAGKDALDAFERGPLNEALLDLTAPFIEAIAEGDVDTATMRPHGMTARAAAVA